MVLVTGSELIDDVRKAPEDVLSMRAQILEVSTMRKTTSPFSRITSVRSSRVYAERIEPGRRLSNGCTTFKIDTEYRSYFQGGP
jgi:hypothetical protein